MRLPRDRVTSWKVLIPVLVAADLVALWVWATRPHSVYLDWLGLGELTDDAPITRLDDWLHWKSGPRTPSGCISLFGLGELFVAGLLLFTLVFLIAIPLVTRWSGGASARRSSAPVNAQTAAALRFRVRTTLAAIAILGLYLSWEVHAWRTWRLRMFYLSRAAQEASGERTELKRLESMRSILADVKAGTLRPDDYPVGKRGGFQSKGSLIAEGFTNQDRLEREITYLSAKIPALTALKRKYELAAADPNIAVDPDAPFPARQPESNEGSARDPARSLAAFDVLARAYPDLVEAHLASAWIRATRQDARDRDGKLAVASATRACELTNWRDTSALSVLAAAYAESGDFASAVKWQQKVVDLTTNPANAPTYRERLDMYLAGKPYRQK